VADIRKSDGYVQLLRLARLNIAAGSDEGGGEGDLHTDWLYHSTLHDLPAAYHEPYLRSTAEQVEVIPI
jgi:hypothetical protein